MTDIVHFEPLKPSAYTTYIKVGTKAYNQHYKHLWKNQNSTPYLNASFTLDVLEQEAQDTNTSLFLIKKKNYAIGILKIVLQSALEDCTEKRSLCIEKIYILKENTGQGVGKKVLQFVTLRAQELQKKIVWLDTMQKGPALHFYLKNGFEIYREKTLHFSETIAAERPMFVLTKAI